MCWVVLGHVSLGCVGFFKDRFRSVCYVMLRWVGFVDFVLCWVA